MQQAPGSHAPVSQGLEGVVVLESKICFVDGLEGRLLYEGYNIHDLAEHATFEEVAYLLWHGDLPTRDQLDRLNRDLAAARALPEPVMELAGELQHFPRHLGIHSGGMVLCDRPVVEVCPVEWARMEDRSVLQWDKDDCAAAGLVKFDLLGLGMLSVLHYTVDHVRHFHGVEVDLAALEQEKAVYEMLSRADSVGVFQVESRAQMATLPRLKPREFYDLIVEVALIRPGPIQGGSVHPYIRRRNEIEPVTIDLDGSIVGAMLDRSPAMERSQAATTPGERHYAESAF